MEGPSVVRPDKQRVRVRRDEGLTLVEMLVALLVIGVLLSAFAASLITFTREVNVNEQRILATQVLSRSQEDFQLIPFDLAGTYESELGALATAGVDTSASPPVFGSPAQEVVLFPGPDNTGCPISDPTCGVVEDVRPAFEVVQNGGFDFELFRVFTWVDRSGDGVPDVKRLTSIVRWTALGREFEEVSTAERVATRGEAGDPTTVRMFTNLGPLRTSLETDGFTTQDITALVRFTQPVQSARLEFYSVDSVSTDPDTDETIVTLALRSVPMVAGAQDPGGGAGFIDFSLTLPQGAWRFTNGPRLFRFVGVPFGDPEITTLRAIQFDGSDLEFVEDDLGEGIVEPPDGPGDGDGDDDGDTDFSALGPLGVSDVAVSRTTVGLTSPGARLGCPLRITALVSGTSDSVGTVTLGLQGPSQAATRTMTPTTTPVASGSQQYEYEFNQGQSYSFANNQTWRFTVTVTRPDGSAGPEQSVGVVFRNNQGCG